MKSKIAAVLAIMLLFTALSASVGTVTAQAKDKCILRVKISTIGSVKTLAFTPEGTYATDNGKTLKKGVVCTVKIEGSTAVLYQEGKEVCRGSNGYFRLYKTDAGYKGLKIQSNRYGLCNYLGDMVFAKSGSYLLAVNYVDMETYLVGVVVGEIGEGSPLEAIKAQAVAARTYAYNLRKSGTSPLTYDIGDTSSNQVYKGYSTSWKRCIQAVQETAGQILTHSNGKLCGAWYSDNNGGQTRTNVNAWGGTKEPYLEVSDDTYDYNCGASASVLYMAKQEMEGRGTCYIIDERIRKVMETELKIALYEKGYSTLEGNYVINGVTGAQLHTQRFPYESNSKCYNFLRVTVSVNAIKGQQGSGTVKKEFMRVSGVTRNAGLYDGPSSSYEKLASLWAGTRVEVLDKSGNYYKVITAGGTIGYMSKSYLSGSVIAYTDVAGIEPEPSPTPTETPTVTPAETPTATPEADPSQTPEQPAGTEEPQETVAAPSETPTEAETEQPAANPSTTPEITEDTTVQPEESVPVQRKKCAIVVNVNVSVNMRSAPSASSTKIGTVAKGVEVEVLEQLNGWAKVRTADGTVGYISTDYLSIYYVDNGVETPEIGEEASFELDLFIDDIRQVSLAAGQNLNSRLMYYVYEYEDYFVLSMRGNGHGVGLSQRGAIARAKDGHDSNQIMGFYYPGAVIMDSLYVVTDPNKEEPEDPSKDYGTVTTQDMLGSVNVRAEATTDSAVLGMLAYGARVELIEKQGEWYKVNTRYGEGYIYAAYITPDKPEIVETPTPSEEPAATPDITPDNTAEPTPGSSSEAPTQTPTVEPTPTATPVIVTKGKVINCNVAVNMRSGPSTSHTKIGQAAKGTIVTILDKIGDWYYLVLPNGTKGYIRGDYLSIYTETVTPTASATATPTATPTAKPTPTPTQSAQTGGGLKARIECNSAANVRSGPSTSYQGIGSVKKNSTVTVLGKKGGWYRIRLDNGLVGYTSGSYVKPIATSGKITANGVNLRRGTGTGYSQVAVLRNGEAVTVLDVSENGWYKLKTAEGKTGWVKGDYLSV